MITDPSAVPLASRAWIGDGRHGALVSADATIDWYCPGGAGAPAVMWRLLDPAGGAVRIGPQSSGSASARRLPRGSIRYLPGTNISEVVLEAAGGRRLSVVDLVPWAGPGTENTARLVRIARALSGPIDVEVEVYPAGPFKAARQVVSTPEGLVVDDVVVRVGFPLHPEPLDRDTPRWRAVQRLDAGEGFVLTVDGRSAQEPPLTLDEALRILGQTATAWRSWLSVLSHSGPYHAQVERSVLAVRSLTGPGGAPLSAATTSLPRRAGGERSSDGRWVRWRDVASTVSGFARTGFAEDAEAAEAWLRRAVTDAPLPWPAWLDPDGQATPAPAELPLSGWRRSQPVVSGVDAAPVDLGAFGAVVASAGASTRGPGGRPDDRGQLSAALPALGAAADWVTDNWSRPDAGPWLSEGPPGMHVASRIEAWAGLQLVARLAREENPLDLSAPVWQQEARSVLAWIEDKGIAPDGGLRRDGSDGAGDEPDAALLRAVWLGPWPAQHPVVTATVDRVIDRLSSAGLLYRYPEKVDDGRAGPDNPDLTASLWAVRALAELGRWEEAHERMEAVLALAGPAGLLSEAGDPVARELMGNLPAASVHLALVEAAFALARGPA